MEELVKGLGELVSNLRERIHHLETFEQEKAFIVFSRGSSDILLTFLEQQIPDLSVTLTQGTYIAQLILDAAADAGTSIRAVIQLDGVSQAPELVNMATQTWKIIVPYEETRVVTVAANISDGVGAAVVRWLNTQLIISRIGAPST